MDNLFHCISLIWDDTLTGKNLLPLREQILPLKVSSRALTANCIKGMWIVSSIHSILLIPFQGIRYVSLHYFT